MPSDRTPLGVIAWGFSVVDVSEEASRLTVPTPVLHATGDGRIPFEEGRFIASTIPSARFVPLDSGNHILPPASRRSPRRWRRRTTSSGRISAPKVRQPSDG